MAQLRNVRLEEVARYLECNPKKLSIALKHLAAVPSAIEYSRDAAVSIKPAVLHVEPTPEAAAKAASLAAADAAWHVMAKEEMDKILRKAIDRLDQAGGKGRDYLFEEMVAAAAAERAEEKAAAKKEAAARPPTLDTRTVDPAAAGIPFLEMKATTKWLN